MTVLTPPADVVARRVPWPWVRKHKQGDGFWNGAASKCAIAAVSLFLLWLTWRSGAHTRGWNTLWTSGLGRPMLIAGFAYGGCTLFWTAWRLLLAIRYRPVAAVADEVLPTITAIVPAFNEGPLVSKTLRSLAQSDYPADRMHIIVVDDGSTDDTWRHIRREARRIGSRITALHFNENRGKRWALWEGFRRGRSDVFVTVDSDSIVEPDALRALVGPLVRDKGVGAVAGNVGVLNDYGGLIPQMLGVRYVMTFDYKRAAQSMMGGGTVLCVAGALAAYRRSAVMPVLNRWLHQTYLGGHARAGEDHAMTNFVLKQGYKVKYQRTARVRTQSPTTYAGLAKMFLRWGRSNVRETVHFSTFIFKRFRAGPLAGIRFNYFMCASGLLVPYVFLAVALGLAVLWPAVFGLKLLAACVSGSMFALIFYAVRKRRFDAVFAIPYGFYSTLLLGWVWPYALLTSHKSVWMTRKANPTNSGSTEAARLPRTLLSGAVGRPRRLQKVRHSIARA